MDVMARVRKHYEVAKTLVPEDRIVGVFKEIELRIVFVCLIIIPW